MPCAAFEAHGARRDVIKDHPALELVLCFGSDLFLVSSYTVASTHTEVSASKWAILSGPVPNIIPWACSLSSSSYTTSTVDQGLLSHLHSPLVHGLGTIGEQNRHALQCMSL